MSSREPDRNILRAKPYHHVSKFSAPWIYSAIADRRKVAEKGEGKGGDRIPGNPRGHLFFARPFRGGCAVRGARSARAFCACFLASSSRAPVRAGRPRRGLVAWWWAALQPAGASCAAPPVAVRWRLPEGRAPLWRAPPLRRPAPFCEWCRQNGAGGRAAAA